MRVDRPVGDRDRIAIDGFEDTLAGLNLSGALGQRAQQREIRKLRLRAGASADSDEDVA